MGVPHAVSPGRSRARPSRRKAGVGINRSNGFGGLGSPVHSPCGCRPEGLENLRYQKVGEGERQGRRPYDHDGVEALREPVQGDEEPLRVLHRAASRAGFLCFCFDRQF